MTTQRLLQIKEKIDNAKTQQAEVKGQIHSVEEQMSTKFKVKTVDAASKELKKRAGELDQMEKEFETGEVELEKAYSWNE